MGQTDVTLAPLNKPLDPLGPPNSLPLHPTQVKAINFYLKMMMAISKAGDTCTQQQLTDALTTQMNAQLEEAIYKGWNDGTLQKDLEAIKNLVEDLNMITTTGTSDQRTAVQQLISEMQSKFSADQTSAQTDENQADQIVQTSQTQTGQMSSFLQQIAQLASACNQIVSYLSNVLSR